MSLSKPLALVISPTLHDRPRTNLVPWKVAINRVARAVFAEWDDFGFLFGVCDDAVWAVLNTGCCGADQSSLPQLPWVPVLILLPVTFLNAPRTPGLPGSHAQRPSVQRSSIAWAMQIALPLWILTQTPFIVWKFYI